MSVQSDVPVPLALQQTDNTSSIISQKSLNRLRPLQTVADQLKTRSRSTVYSSLIALWMSVSAVSVSALSSLVCDLLTLFCDAFQRKCLAFFHHVANLEESTKSPRFCTKI